MLGLTWNEWALVAFLALLIISSGWLARFGEWLGELARGPDKRFGIASEPVKPPPDPTAAKAPDPPKGP